jgi:cytochrome c biogenesis protein CcdA
MVETIAPVVHGERRSRYGLALTLYALGAIASAGAVGAVAGAIGSVLGAPWGAGGLAAVAIVAFAYALREAAGLPLPVPDRHRQVPLWWRTFYSPEVAALLYGLGLGVGYLTYLSFGTYVAVTAAAVTTGNPAVGALLCAPFGLGRALSVIVANSPARRGDASSGIDKVDDLGQSRWPQAVNGAALLGVTAAAALASI